MDYVEGMLVKGSGPEVYLIEAGRRRKIPDPPSFIGQGYRWDDITILADQELKTLPLGEHLPSIVIPYAEKQDSLGNHHYMATHATLVPAMHQIHAITQTCTRNFWSGFTGGVLVLLVGEWGRVIGDTGIQAFTVDGLITDTNSSSRTDCWSKELTPDAIEQTRTLAIIHKIAPQSRRVDIFMHLEHVARESAEQAKPVASVIIEMAAILA